jgi:glycosyltransferase involved in cell wall biosynthesis
MISILIPLYNYKVHPLVEVLSQQAKALDVPYEILVQDDASTEPFEENITINLFPHTRYFKSEVNQGRPKTREILAKKAEYDCLLFLDVDVFPEHDDFLNQYVRLGLNAYEMIVGGITYEETPPVPSKYLRWYYGMHREKKSAARRNKEPFIITPANIFIRKSLFLKVNQFTGTKYGMDLALSYQLKTAHTNILHIDNPVYHLGLETNTEYLEKSLKAVENLVDLEEQGGISSDFTGLQRLYLKLKQWYLTGIVEVMVSWFEAPIRRQLLSTSPNLRLMDLYRLNHYIRLKK